MLWSPRVGLQLRAVGEQHRAGARRHRALLGPHAVRLALEPVSAIPASSSGGWRSASTRPTGLRSCPIRRPSRRSVGNAATNEIDLIDPDYKYPSLVRVQPRLRPRPRVLRAHRHGRVPLLAERQRRALPEPEPAAGRARASTAVRSIARNVNTSISDAILLTNTDQGDCVEHRVQGRSAVPQRLLHERRRTSTASRRRFSTAPRRRRRRTGATSTSSGDPNNPPLRALELRPGSPHHVLRRLRHPGAAAASRSRRRRSTAASRAVPGRRTSATTSTATSRTTNDLLYIPASASRSRSPSPTARSQDLMTFVNAEQCLADYIGQIARAQRVPRALDQHLRPAAQCRAAVQAGARPRSRGTC